MFQLGFAVRIAAMSLAMFMFSLTMCLFMRRPETLGVITAPLQMPVLQESPGCSENRAERWTPTLPSQCEPMTTLPRGHLQRCTLGLPSRCVSVLVQYFRHPTTMHQSLPLFAKLPEVLEILVNDDSHDADWGPIGKTLCDLSVPLIVKQSPNLNEIRAYNGLAKMASGELIMTWQDDDVPLPGPWLGIGVFLLRSVESLVLLGSNMAMSGNWAQDPKFWADRMRGSLKFDIFFAAPCNTSKGRRCIETYDPTGSYPFMYAAWLNIGPFLMYRNMFLDLCGFDESLAPAGAPGMGLDEDLVFRIWKSGHTCGMFDVGRHARAGDVENPNHAKTRTSRNARTVKNRKYIAEKVGGVAALLGLDKAAQRLNAFLPRRL